MAAAVVAARLRLVMLPVLLALVGATLLAPPVGWLRRRGWPAAAAAPTVLVGFLLVLGGSLAALAPPVVAEVDELDVGIGGGLEEVQRWLVEGPVGLTDAQVNEALDRVQQQVTDNVDALTSGALTGAVIVAEVLAGLLLALVLLFFFLKDGERLWAWLCGLAPPRQREHVRAAGAQA